MRIGLTGGIASGKSAVSAILRGLGADVLDGDIVAREVAAPGKAGLNAVAEAFGCDVLQDDGSLNRKKLGAVVFGDRRELRRLNGILHPLIKAELERRARAIEAEHPDRIIVLDVALLIECAWQDMADEVWLVRAPMEQRVRRIMERNGLGKEEALNRIRAQMPDDKKAKYARVIIENDRDLRALSKKVTELYSRLMGENG